MFYRASSFDQPLGNWNVSTITDMSAIFALASSFNQPIVSWNLSNVIDIEKKKGLLQIGYGSFITQIFNELLLIRLKYNFCSFIFLIYNFFS